MVKSKAKEEHQLKRKLAIDGYRLPHGYELVKCKHSHCGYAFKSKDGTVIAPMRSKKKKSKK